MKEVTFYLPGKPMGKERARSTRNGQHYTPQKTREYEEALRWEFMKAAGDNWEPIEGAVTLIITALFQLPKAWSEANKAKALMGRIKPTVKPDADNIAKLMDGLNGYAWLDDAQVVRLSVTKKYAIEPRLIISILGGTDGAD